jgi:hypothetical protein
VFIGHYGVSLGAKPYRPRLSLGVLFLAVQFLDVVFSILVLLGVEKLRIVPGFTAYNPYDLYWMPYSHSLVGALGWSVLFGAGGWLWLRRSSVRERSASAIVLAAAVFSHFLLDVPMHTPDLPLTLAGESAKIGFGLWNHPFIATACELAVLVAGGAVALRGSRPRTRGARVATAVFGLILALLTVATRFMPAPPSASAFAVQALVSYLVLAGAAEWIDRKREWRAG